jgi:hypothetical protein
MANYRTLTDPEIITVAEQFVFRAQSVPEEIIEEMIYRLRRAVNVARGMDVTMGALLYESFVGDQRNGPLSLFYVVSRPLC